MKTNGQHSWTDKQVGPYLDRDKVGAFYEKVRAMAVKEFGEDCDGDIPLDIDITDRTRFERLHFLTIPYDDKVKGPEEQALLIQRLLANLKIASDHVDRFFRCLQFQDFDWDEVVRSAREHGAGVNTATDTMLSAENAQLSARVEEVEKRLHELNNKRARELRTNETIKRARGQREHAYDALNAIIEAVGEKKGKLAQEVAKIANGGFKVPK